MSGQFSLREQGMDLPMADPVQVLGVSAAFGLGYQMVSIALAERDFAFAQRANQVR